MNHFSFLFIILILICQIAKAQDDKKYLVKAGMRPKDAISFTEIYLYPSFISGKVNFKNHHFGSGMMNYNRFTNEVDFIRDKDTLALADPETVKNIVIGNDVFYYQIEIGCMQRVVETPYAILAKKEYLELTGRKRHPNSGEANTTSNGSYNHLITTGAGVTSGLTLNMIEKVDLIYHKKTEYYWANSNGFFLKADKKNVLRLYPGKKTALSSYVEDNKVDFSNEEALQNLVKTIAEIQ
jgi:hypothetical protein